jgi:hypothetical protein
LHLQFPVQTDRRSAWRLGRELFDWSSSGEHTSVWEHSTRECFSADKTQQRSLIFPETLTKQELTSLQYCGYYNLKKELSDSRNLFSWGLETLEEAHREQYFLGCIDLCHKRARTRTTKTTAISSSTAGTWINSPSLHNDPGRV